MSFEIKGKLYKIFPTEQKTGTFQARDFVLAVEEGNYTEYIKFQLTQDRCGLIDAFQEEDIVHVHFNLRGREWQDKFFTNLNAWRVDAVSTDSAPPQSNQAFPLEEPAPGDSDEMRAEDFDNLPF